MCWRMAIHRLRRWMRMHNVDLHPITQAAARELLLGVGLGALALASHAFQSPAFDVLVIGGVILVMTGSALGLGGKQLSGGTR